jgi:hypothetical protein
MERRSVHFRNYNGYSVIEVEVLKVQQDFTLGQFCWSADSYDWFSVSSSYFYI